MTSQAHSVITLVDFYIRVVDVFLPCPVASFTGKPLVLMFGEFLVLVGMTFFASFAAGEHRLAGAQLYQRFTTEPAVLPERLWCKKKTSYRIGDHDPQSEQHDPENLWRHVEEATHRVYRSATVPDMFRF